MEYEINRLINELQKCAELLPDSRYMDMPDGGSTPIHEQLRRMIEDRCDRLQYEKAVLIAQVNKLQDILFGIHSLLYPPLLKLDDGRVMGFRPKNIDADVVLQELSDRIRAIPSEIEGLNHD